MRVKIEFEIEIPDNIEHSEDDLEEFLRYSFRDNGCLSGKNPFNIAKYIDVDPIFGTFEWEYID